MEATYVSIEGWMAKEDEIHWNITQPWKEMKFGHIETRLELDSTPLFTNSLFVDDPWSEKLSDLRV